MNTQDAQDLLNLPRYNVYATIFQPHSCRIPPGVKASANPVETVSGEWIRVRDVLALIPPRSAPDGPISPIPPLFDVNRKMYPEVGCEFDPDAIAKSAFANLDLASSAGPTMAECKGKFDNCPPDDSVNYDASSHSDESTLGYWTCGGCGVGETSEHPPCKIVVSTPSAIRFCAQCASRIEIVD